MKRRAYQLEALVGLRKHRSFFTLWRRQGGKSTTLGAAAIDEMTRQAGRTVTYASASLLLGREIVLKEAEILYGAINEFRAQAAVAQMRIETADARSHKAIPDISTDDFADLFESQRLEFRLWHDRTRFSRTQVIAPNPATARGWSGTVFLDEFGFIRDFRDLWEALEPIISTNPDFKFVGATTPPVDDAHFSYEITAPPIGTEFPVNPRGNWYRSEAGELIHRVDIFDAYAAGQKLYDRQTGRELTPEEHFKGFADKDAWRRNYKVEHVLGGSAACGLIELQTAQTRGIGKCALIEVDSEMDFDRALAHLREKVSPTAIVGHGFDIATTEKESSNPSSWSVLEQSGADLVLRAVIVWKTKDPAIAKERCRRILETIPADRPAGRARRLCIDSSNETYFATELARDLAGHCPIELVKGGESVRVPGQEQPTNMKTFTGDMLVGDLGDNRLTLPPERYLREDWRLVRKQGGRYECPVDQQGRHGDTFDSTKLARLALSSRSQASMTLI